MPGLPEFPELNHWHAWVDNIIGKDTELRTPFPDGVRITEAALLAQKATRYPNEELAWDRSQNAFTNHEEATNTIVRRNYREGFRATASRVKRLSHFGCGTRADANKVRSSRT